MSPPTDKLILGLDVGGTNTTAVLATAAGEFLVSRREASGAHFGFTHVWDTIRRTAHTVLAEASDLPRPTCVGVSIGGPVDVMTGTVYGPPNLPGWDQLPLRQLLNDEFDLPVYVEHDAKAGALAEWMYGAGRGATDLVFLTLGTGLGAGIIADGRLIRGRNNNVGEVGHWRVSSTGPDIYGKRGSWEGFSSGAGLAARANEADSARWPHGTAAVDVVSAARRGEVEGLSLVSDFAGKLGTGIALLVDLLSPEMVILGSLAVRAGDLFLPEVQRIVDAECTSRNLPCPVIAAGLGENIGMGAAIAAAAINLQEGIPT